MMQSNSSKFKIGKIYINENSKVKFLIKRKGLNFYGIKNLESGHYLEYRKSTIECGENHEYLKYILTNL